MTLGSVNLPSGFAAGIKWLNLSETDGRLHTSFVPCFLHPEPQSLGLEIFINSNQISRRDEAPEAYSEQPV